MELKSALKKINLEENFGKPSKEYVYSKRIELEERMRSFSSSASNWYTEEEIKKLLMDMVDKSVQKREYECILIKNS